MPQGKLGYSQAKESKWGPISPTHKKFILRYTKDLNLRLETTKLHKEKI